MMESVKSRQEHEEIKRARRDIKKASKVSRFVLGNIDKGITDMPAKTRRFPYLLTYAQISPEVSTLVRENLSIVGVQSQTYNEYKGTDDYEDRIKII